MDYMDFVQKHRDSGVRRFAPPRPLTPAADR
jgi:hypothetical protein